jgi:hypothetical protein
MAPGFRFSLLNILPIKFYPPAYSGFDENITNPVTLL